METVTYNLRDESGNSDNYYKKIVLFSDEVVDYVETFTGDIINNYKLYLQNSTDQLFRSRGEYGVELLTLGMTWRRYLGASQVAPKTMLRLLSWLYKLRRSKPGLKNSIDKIRGFLGGTYLAPAIGAGPVDNSPSYENFERLILWLEATGEFKDEVKRLTAWKNYFAKTEKTSADSIILSAVLLVEWFEEKATEELGEYTSGLDSFLALKHKSYRFREDEIFTGKEPVKYYMNMVGSEIMNRGFKPGFKNVSKHVLLVPGCMRFDEGKCKADMNGQDISCCGCNEDCRINELTKLGKKENFAVFIVPHSSSFAKWLERWQSEADTGLIAVACLLNLVPGGYEMRELNLNSQCVLLDYCGCKKHWHDEGIVTDLNTKRILELINKTANKIP